MFFFNLIILNLLFAVAEQNFDSGHCEVGSKTCNSAEEISDEKLLFYDVNPPEGFNLRRDVYMRFAIMLAESRKSGKRANWQLILPPWFKLYHWRSQTSRNKPTPWRAFFNIKSLKSFAPVAELHEVFSKTTSRALELDRLYVLQNFDDAFEGGTFIEKWEISKDDCDYDGQFWGYNNVTAKEIICVKFQGKINKIWELISQHPTDKKVMISHGEIPLHDSYGTKAYWDCRKSMKFNVELVRIATDFIQKHLDCNVSKCATYISVHWRRQDYLYARKNDLPSIAGTAEQIDIFAKKNKLNIKKVFIASDATAKEMELLEKPLKALHYEVYFHLPSKSNLERYKDGGIAIIDQIICSHGAYFIGTHESTFTFRIQEEREILGFDSKTTFNRLCPDSGPCEKPSKWTIVK